MKGLMKRFVSLLLAVVLILTLPQYSREVFAAKSTANLPRPADSYTQDGMLALLKEYNPDAYHIVSTEIYDFNSDPSVWFVFSENMISNLDSAVHETFHGYAFDTAYTMGKPENIYTGNDRSYALDYRGIPLFASSEAFEDLDPSLRTGRFETYVGKSSTTSANTNGVYGLLNEFSACYWGLNTMSSLMDYYKEYDTDNTCWKAYVTSLANNMNAYAEFKYWILSYILYAKDNHPKTYKAIIQDRGFCTAYTIMNEQFTTLINDNLAAHNTINDYLSDRNCAIVASDGIYFYEGNTFSGKDLHDFITLMKEMNSDSRYSDISKIIEKKAINSSKGKPSKPIWSTIKRESDGIMLQWRENSDAKGYYIYRSTNDGAYKLVKKIKNASKTTWIDPDATDTGSTYKYKLKAYTRKKNKIVKSEFSSVLSSN